ncbi:hypothetical protein ACIBI4_07090 [Streptomyces sp. NPDC050418]|uniref:hypothetical protein n=1 Tax=Streptomyces sp. NPDC050418 TaxID=3365612 RepID=UPI0037B8B5CA
MARRTLIVLILWPLLLAAGFGVYLWQDATLSRDELSEVGVDAARTGVAGWYTAFLDGSTGRDQLQQALEGAAQRQGVPVPVLRPAEVSMFHATTEYRGEDDVPVVAHAYQVAPDSDWQPGEGRDDEVDCLILVIAENGDGAPYLPFEPFWSKGLCTDSLEDMERPDYEELLPKALPILRPGP